ncbi:MAG: PD-(D/E)XK nuclease family protein [Candidatus Methylomirabilota bacterium]
MLKVLNWPEAFFLLSSSLYKLTLFIMGYYNPPKPEKYNFNPKSHEPFRLSRSGIDLFISCPRCFYLDKRFGVGQPPGFPFSLNAAVDFLLKKEFDIHRTNNTTHPLMQSYGVDAIPFTHPKLDEWRENFKGIHFLHQPTNLLITGAIDDVWKNKSDELLIVDYKATSKDGEVSLDAEWQGGYKRQMEVYQWLFRQNGFKVSKTGYFVYCNGIRDNKAFDAKLEFKVKIIPYDGDDSWIEKTLSDIKTCLLFDKIPKANKDCDYCKYRRATSKFENQGVVYEEIENSDKKTKPKEEFDGKLF